MYSDVPVQPVIPKPNYLALTKNNQASSAVIESLGGIQNTIEPMQASMISHELRPYDIIPNYQKELQKMQ
jgi:hypothetical protein